MISKSIDKIELDDLNALLGRVRESKTLEFKRALPKGEAGALKVRAGVTALANTSGGDFVIGIAEEKGLAHAVPGIEVPDADQYKQWLVQILRTLIEPPLPGFDIQEVPCGGDLWAFVVRVPRSWIGPHRVTSNNHFYIRTSASTVPLDVADLRTAFGLRDGGIERIEMFRRDRLAKIMAGETPIPIADGPSVVLHMAPLPSFINRDLVDIVGAVARGTHFPLPLSSAGGGHAKVNLLGVLNSTGDYGGGATSYGQLFRSGAYEGVDCPSEVEGQRYLAGIGFPNMIVGAVRRYLALQQHYGFAFPTFAMLSLCNASGLRLTVPTELGGTSFYPSNPLSDPVIAFPEILIDSPEIDVPTALRPLLDIVWNAFELPACGMYNAQGGWIGT